MMRVVFDTEFDSLAPTKIWCIVAKDIDTEEKHVFRSDTPNWEKAFKRFAKGVTLWIGVNSLVFDGPNINYLMGGDDIISPMDHLDLLICSRLFWYKRPGGHSVGAWAERFGMVKPEIDVYDDPNRIDDYVDRCEEDVEIQHRIYLELKRLIDDPDWADAIKLEHDHQRVCMDMHENGFSFDKEKAVEYHNRITGEMDELYKEMLDTIPDVLHKGVDLILKRKKDGTPHANALAVLGRDTGFNHGDIFNRDWYEPFNPASPKQRLNLLNESGWDPVDKTKGHKKCERDLWIAEKYHRDDRILLKTKLKNYQTYGWKVNETNLNTLHPTAPAGAHLLASWLTLEGRRGDLVEWIDAYNENSGRIHGTFNGIGSWTGRMSHIRPNQGNIFREFRIGECKDSSSPSPVEDVKIRFNGVLRGLWKAEPGAYLVGTDAEGIQMRVLAHYIDDEDYTRTIVEGDKEDGSDIHNLNRKLLGEVCRSRDDAKTFIYAWLLGAGGGEVGRILLCSPKQANIATRRFVAAIPGLSELKRNEIPADAKRRYFIGFDGRKVVVPSEHHVLAGYLQSGESTLMKRANHLWRVEADSQQLRYKQVDMVHDEWQTEVYDELTANQMGDLQCEAITQAGLDLGVRCHMAGEYKVGKNWRETH